MAIKIKQNHLNYLAYFSILNITILAITLLLPYCHDTVNAVEDTLTTEAGLNVGSMISLALQDNIDIDVVPKGDLTFGSNTAKLTVTTNNRSGYSIYINTADGNTALKSIDSTNTASVASINENSPLNNFLPNTWGYSLQSGENKTFSPIPATSTAAVTTEVTAYHDEYDLSFGVAVGSDLPVGRYINTVLISAIANPSVITSLEQLNYMQGMTTDICQNSTIGASKRLIDARDGNKYWVAKLQDDNCWMTQNLALNLVADEAIKPTDSDVSMEWNSRSKYPPRDTNAVKFPGGNFEAAIATNSWNLGKAVYATPLHNTVCNSYGAVYGSYYSLYSTDKYGEKCGKVGFIDITDEWQPTLVAQEGEYTFPDGTTYTGLVAANPENKTYDAHYLVGNFYQYNAATAGTGLDTKAGTSAPESICPKGWKLPTASTTGFETKGSFAYLLRQYGLATSSTAGIISNDEYNIAALPFSYVRTGEVDSQYSTIFDAGTISSFWSSYPGAILYSHNISLSPSFSTVNTRGHSVRCVVVTE